MSIYYARLLSLSLSFSLSLFLSLSLSSCKVCGAQKEVSKFRCVFFSRDIFRVLYTVRVEVKKEKAPNDN